jgi:[acyl-carrier-protein] S-malonyltransferase
MRRLLLGFPGQGSQKINVGQALAEAYPNSAGRVIRLADENVDGLFSKLVWNSDDPNAPKLLSQTENTQPVVLTTSIAVLESLKESTGFSVNQSSVGCLVGHSLGEFSCLVAAGALDFLDAVRLVRRRGEVMQLAAKQWGKQSSMAAVLGLSWANAKEIEESCPSSLFVQAVCDNGLEQTVLAGCEAGVTWGIERARTKHSAKRGLKVNVSCPFHSTVMRPAADMFEDDLWRANIREPLVPVIFGVDAQAHSKPSDIKKALLKGMYSPVRWADTVRAAGMVHGPLSFREIGGETLKFGVSSVPGVTVGKPIRAVPEDIQHFTFD